MEKIAVIDLGTASIRFDIFLGTKSSKRFELLHSERFMPRLGSNLFDSKCLSSIGKAKTIAIFKDLSACLLQHQPCKVLAVATSAFREATDGEEFLLELSNISKFPIQLISGEEEALLIAKGIFSFSSIPLEGRFACIDIGGGSTELIFCEEKRIASYTSLPVGALRSHQLHIKTLPAQINSDASRITSLKKHTSQWLETVSPGGNYSQLEFLIGSSGTARTLERLYAFEHNEESSSIPRSCISRFIENSRYKTLEEMCKIPGMESNRADLILAGSIILDTIMEKFSAEKLYVSKYSLRHGLLAQALEIGDL